MRCKEGSHAHSKQTVMVPEEGSGKLRRKSRRATRRYRDRQPAARRDRDRSTPVLSPYVSDKQVANAVNDNNRHESESVSTLLPTLACETHQ